MQAALKAALGEIARGISTGLVVLAGSPSCPAVSCTCPICPDCICHGGVAERSRRDDGGDTQGGSLAACAAVLLVGVLAGVVGLLVWLNVAKTVPRASPGHGGRGRLVRTPFGDQ